MTAGWCGPKYLITDFYSKVMLLNLLFSTRRSSFYFFVKRSVEVTYVYIYICIKFTIISHQTSQLKLQDLRHWHLLIFSYKPLFLFNYVCLNNFGLFKEPLAFSHYESAVYLQFYISFSGISWYEAWCKHVHSPCLPQEEIKTQDNFTKFIKLWLEWTPLFSG